MDGGLLVAGGSRLASSNHIILTASAASFLNRPGALEVPKEDERHSPEAIGVARLGPTAVVRVAQALADRVPNVRVHHAHLGGSGAWRDYIAEHALYLFTHPPHP